jgi:hypothetical protein
MPLSFKTKLLCLISTVCIIATLFVFADKAMSEEQEAAQKVYLICKNKKEVRTMRVQVAPDGICHAYYSKEGVEKEIGSGRNHESCKNFVMSIKTNLEKSNWACRDISDTKIISAVGN